MWGWLTRTLLKDLIGFNAVVMLGLLWLKPAWVGYYGVGVLLSMAYAGTLLLSVKLALGRGQSGLVMMGAFLRMMTIPWVVAVLGHFEWTPTMVVFCGCLSYKWILFFDVFRYGLRQQSHRVNSITQLGN